MQYIGNDDTSITILIEAGNASDEKRHGAEIASAPCQRKIFVLHGEATALLMADRDEVRYARDPRSAECGVFSALTFGLSSI